MSSNPENRPSQVKKEAKIKAGRYCAYQERTQHQVREKLLGMGLKWDMAEEIIAELITEGFINEERFARSFAGGKFRLKKWGRLKIERELQNRGLSEYCVRKGMEEIEEDDYLATATELIKKKAGSISGTPAEIRLKLTRFMAYKGYEYDIINGLVNQQLNS